MAGCSVLSPSPLPSRSRCRSRSAFAADPPPKSEADKAHPDAKKVNDRNPMVIHAGPGMPLAGARFEPPKAAKGSPAVGGAGSH